MGDTAVLDPYEQQLLAVFNDYDYDNIGSLDQHGLTQLCQTLQLEEHSNELLNNLLGDSQRSRATFFEFKDALLTLLGNMQHGKLENEECIEKESPDREVSPKLVYGTKKYGRRSRPKVEDEESNKNSRNVQRSNSEIVNSKKRKTNFKLTRCSSLPTNDGIALMESCDSEICTEEMLKSAWNSLGVGKDGYLNKNELILVCNAIGLKKLADGVLRQLSDKLSVNYEDRISFNEVRDALKKDDVWSDILDTIPSEGSEDSPKSARSNTLFPDSQTFQLVSLGPDGNGVITTDLVIEMWENVGITAAKELLHELGFNDRQIYVEDLSSALYLELKGIQETNTNFYNNPHITLLQGNLCLYQTEIRCLKSILEQMRAEREKLKIDIIEANNRAALLAQEVDDNHTKMEENTLNHVKLLEQRQAEILKDLTKQFSEEKEDLTQLNRALEQRVFSLEQEIVKLKNDLETAQCYLANVEKENQNLGRQVFELQQSKRGLENHVALLETECQKYSELEHEQIQPLLVKLNSLETENVQLKDRSDEMATEIENLVNQIAAMRTKNSSTPTLDQTMDESVSVVYDSFGVTSKRRSVDSPSRDPTSFNMVDGSPRLGKMRKLPKNPEDRLTSSESGFDTEIDGIDSSFSASSNGGSKEITRLHAKVAFLEQILIQHAIPIPNYENADYPWFSNSNETITAALTKRVTELEDVILNMKQNSRNSQDLIEENHIESKKKVSVDSGTMTVISGSDLDGRLDELEKEKDNLAEKCKNFESCVELLKEEYEKCEDYWAGKLDEERQIFEQEQNQSSEKLNDLINKMAEYEQQFQEQDNRLPPIEENDNLEKQFTDLEQEYEEYKLHTESLLVRKDREIELLKQKLTELALERRKTFDVQIQVDSLSEYNIVAQKMMQLTNHVVEATNFISAEIPSTPNSSEASDSKNLSTKYFSFDGTSTPNGTLENYSLPVNWSKSENTSLTLPTSAASSSNSTPCRPKRTRKHEKNMNMYKRNVPNKNAEEMKEGSVLMSISSVQNLTSRRHHLEQRCRQLQMVVKQQQNYVGRILHQCWQSQQGELALKHAQERLDQQSRGYRELLDKLAKADMLVKELYVENSYLIANVQRLEQQCQMLAHCNTNNSL